MSDEWWARLLEQDPPPVVRLVLPAALGESALLREMAGAVQRAREVLDRELLVYRERAREAVRRDDPLAAARWAGGVQAAGAAVEHLDGELLTALGMYDQWEVQDGLPPERVREMAEDLCWRVRPEIPIPDIHDPTLGLRLLLLVRARRDALVAQAVRANFCALHHYTSDDGEVCTPQYEEAMARAKAYALAADWLDAAMAEVHHAVADYRKFVAVHGTWVGRLVFT